LFTEVRIFRAVNKALNKYRKAKKARVRQDNTFIIEDAQDIISQKKHR
jgi:hypothetical protein